MSWDNALLYATAFWIGFIVGVGGTLMTITAMFVDWS